MHKLIVIDLTAADLKLFEAYERKVIPLLSKHGGRLETAMRSLDNKTETHVLFFPDAQSFDNFLSDPNRKVLQDEWKLTGALTTVSDANEICY